MHKHTPKPVWFLLKPLAAERKCTIILKSWRKHTNLNLVCNQKKYFTKLHLQWNARKHGLYKNRYRKSLE